MTSRVILATIVAAAALGAESKLHAQKLPSPPRTNVRLLPPELPGTGMPLPQAVKAGSRAPSSAEMNQIRVSSPSDIPHFEDTLARPARIVRLPEPDVARQSLSGNEPSFELPGAGENSGIASFEQRLAALEKAWEKSRRAERDATADAADVCNEARETPSPTIDLIGRIHLDYWSFFDDSPGIGFFENPLTGVDPENRVLLRRARIGLQGDIFENMVYKLDYDFGDPDNPAFKDVYLGFTELPFFGTVLVGNQKRPLGLDQLNSSNANVFMERPLVIDAFNLDARRPGIAAYGYSADEVFNWRYGAYLLENFSNDGEITGDSLQPSANGRLASCPWYVETSAGLNYLHLAIAGVVARPDGDAGTSDTNVNEGRFRSRPEMRTRGFWIDTLPIAGASAFETLGTELLLNLGPFSIANEYEGTWLQRDGGANLFYHGAYVYFAYFLTGESQQFNRTRGTLGGVQPRRNFYLARPRSCDARDCGWGAWQIAARLSYLDLSDADIRGGDERNFTFGLNWWWNSNARMQFNYIYGDIKDHAPVGGFTSGTFNGVGTRFMVFF